MKKKVVAKEAKKTYLKNHKVHLMKRVSTVIEEITVQGYSMAQKQKRIVTHYMCSCKEEDILYRQLNHPELLLSEYTKAAIKR